MTSDRATRVMLKHTNGTFTNQGATGRVCDRRKINRLIRAIIAREHVTNRTAHACEIDCDQSQIRGGDKTHTEVTVKPSCGGLHGIVTGCLQLLVVTSSRLQWKLLPYCAMASWGESWALRRGSAVGSLESHKSVFSPHK
jgi:hypothetical protein